MATALATTREIQNKVFAGIETSQQAVVDFVRSWAESLETTFAKLPELATAEPARPSELLESTFSFTERVFNSNREFATRVFEAMVPATRAATAGTRSATAQANQATQANQAGQPSRAASPKP
jgi:hypothetical protein